MGKKCVSEDCHYHNVTNLVIRNQEIGQLKRWMEQDDALYGLIPDTIRLADVEVRTSKYDPTSPSKSEDQSEDKKEQYLMLIDSFNVQHMWINEKPEKDPNDEDDEDDSRNYTFLLVMPRETIRDKLDGINSEVLSEITSDFIWPFTLFVIFMMIFISYILKKISVSITAPIIDLFKQIQDIITENRNEKNKQMEEQQKVNESGLNQISDKNQNQGQDIMRNYLPKNNEINQLYLSFSNLTKTIKLARTSMY